MLMVIVIGGVIVNELTEVSCGSCFITNTVKKNISSSGVLYSAQKPPHGNMCISAQKCLEVAF